MVGRLRIDFLGVGTELLFKTLSGELEEQGHEVNYRRAVSEIVLKPPPDVVVHLPFDKTANGLVSTCEVATVVPRTTLLVAYFNHVGNSHAMLALHFRRGNCHPRLLLHRPDGEGQSASALASHMSKVAYGPDQVIITAPLPSGLGVTADQDLGEIMATRERFAHLLYTAAGHSWGTWGELTALMHVGDGVARNINAELGGVLREAGLAPWDARWTAQRLAGFVADHRSFILAFGSSHLNLTPSPMLTGSN